VVSTARIEGPPLYRGACASKKDRLPPPFSSPSSPTSLHEGGLVDPQLRASNEGSPRPLVPRAQKIIGLHPRICSKHLLMGVAEAALYWQGK
jgi:hypothetical protein